MAILLLSLTVALALEGDETCPDNTTASHPEDDPVVANLLGWLRNNGAFINEKVVVRHLVPNDATSVRGIFATDDIDVGEAVYSIPWDLILKPPDDEDVTVTSDCSSIEAVADAMSGGGKTPYGKYLLDQPKDYTAGFWSQAARDLFHEMLMSTRSNHLTKLDQLPPRQINEVIEKILEWCNEPRMSDPVYRQAAMLVKARADYHYMIPLYDMANHDNRKTNIIHRYSPYDTNGLNEIKQNGYLIAASKPIKQSEQLLLSYNHCSICEHYVDWFGTPEMFLHYGFLEGMPQRWLFDFARVKFDLDWRDGKESTGEVLVNFLVPPSIKGIALLNEELIRLAFFAEKHRSVLNDDVGISHSEWSSLWQYYDALYNALSYAVQQSRYANVMNDKVWELDDNWWVKDGTLTAVDVEKDHAVYPTIMRNSV